MRDAPSVTADAVRAIVREELAAAKATSAPAAPPAAAPAEPHEDVAALEAARALLSERMADGRWSADDRAALREAIRKLDRSQAEEIFGILFPAINNGKLLIDGDSGPI